MSVNVATEALECNCSEASRAEELSLISSVCQFSAVLLIKDQSEGGNLDFVFQKQRQRVRLDP